MWTLNNNKLWSMWCGVLSLLGTSLTGYWLVSGPWSTFAYVCGSYTPGYCHTLLNFSSSGTSILLFSLKIIFFLGPYYFLKFLLVIYCCYFFIIIGIFSYRKWFQSNNLFAVIDFCKREIKGRHCVNEHPWKGVKFVHIWPLYSSFSWVHSWSLVRAQYNAKNAHTPLKTVRTHYKYYERIFDCATTMFYTFTHRASTLIVSQRTYELRELRTVDE